jgi:7-cyano-7-deazaguanine synthase
MLTSGILLSGGMDSTALAYWKRPRVAFTIDYGQVSAEGEIRAARKISEELGLDHEVIRVDCRRLGSGDLAGGRPNPIAPVPEWWPFRNQLLVTLAAMRAISLGVTELLCGSVKSDGSHADGRPHFYRQISELVSMQEGGISVAAPAILMTSVDLIRASGIDRDVLYWTHSCHKAAFACGKCRGWIVSTGFCK